MAQIDDFFMYENRVEGITDADYQRAQPYVEAAQAFAQTTYQSIYIIDYYRKNFLYVSDNPEPCARGRCADAHRTEPLRLPRLLRRTCGEPPPVHDVLRLPHHKRRSSAARQPQDYAPCHDRRRSRLACPLHRLALTPQGGRTHRVLPIPYGREARVLIGGPPMEEPRDHHPEA